MGTKENCRTELRTAIRQLSDRCLYSASKCGAIGRDRARSGQVHAVTHAIPARKLQHSTGDFALARSRPRRSLACPTCPHRRWRKTTTRLDSDCYLLAKSYFDCREYRRAAHVLRDQTGKKAVFLRCYALYLVGSYSLLFW
ncbi:anaphase-promoting complex subunit 8 [Actinidia rufa]|uniref:Anaphase-promoting complex subunit 8 n=1 Tax=Actinidia rufa TaxID=165716 RepID=A0A7J0GN07_9ERIC|nr:anaphase-promoting complex subunit 8 [Actinidia rufa]